MSRTNVEAFERSTDGFNRRDVEAMLEDLDAEVEFHSAIHEMLRGEATVSRGPAGVRELVEDLYSTFTEVHVEYSDIRDLGDRIVAIGRVSGSGQESGAVVESPLAWIVEFKNAKVIRAWSYLDPKRCLEAAGLSE